MILIFCLCRKSSKWKQPDSLKDVVNVNPVMHFNFRHVVSCLHLLLCALLKKKKTQTPPIVGNAQQFECLGIRPGCESNLFFLITCLLSPPLYHFHPRSAFMDSCPEWVGFRECVCGPFCCDISPIFFFRLHFLLTCFCVSNCKKLLSAAVRKPFLSYRHAVWKRKLQERIWNIKLQLKACCWLA